MANSDLTQFVHDSLQNGVSRDVIRQSLLDAGWSADQAAAALAAFAESDSAIPVPAPRRQVSARDAFLYLVMFGTLYGSAYHAGDLIFDFLNLLLPEPTDIPDRATTASIRFSVATLIITFPAYLFSSSRLLKLVAADSSHRHSAIRKWLTYMTLALAVFIILGDLISLLYSLLSGEMTLRFILKTLTVLVIAGGIFGYYLQQMRQDEQVLGR